MDNNSFKPLPFNSIKNVTNDAVTYIENRKNHTITPLKTRWNKFNRVCAGGIEPNMVITIAGGSGSGKSSVANTLETDLIDINSSEDIVVLSFSFEMLSYRQIGRKLSNKLKRTTSELYSADRDLTESELSKVKEVSEDIKKYNIFYVDTPSTVQKIEETINYFHETIAKDKWLIVILDHALLVEGENERKTIVDLEKMFIRVKKLKQTSIIQIAQLNRNVEQPERINNPALHFPMRGDLAASDAMFQASDYVIVLSRPELLGIQNYGVNRLPVENKVYLHFLKVRDAGEPCILTFDNELKYGNLIETSI